MRRFIVPAVLAFVILAMLAPPGFAQAPAPKVTITGLFDQITSMGRNTYDGNLTRNSDKEWYARTRFRPDFEFAVGRVKAVLGLELDFQYGQSGPNDGGFPGNTSGSACGAGAGTLGGNAGATPPGGKVNISGCLDLNTDVAGLIPSPSTNSPNMRTATSPAYRRSRRSRRTSRPTSPTPSSRRSSPAPTEVTPRSRLVAARTTR